MKPLSRKGKLDVLAVSLYEIHRALEETHTKHDWKADIPKEYLEFLDPFSEQLACPLPPYCTYDHSVALVDGKEPPFGPHYGMSRDELVALKPYIEKNIATGFISASSSPAGAQVLFIKKGDGSFRLCVDY